MDTFATLRAALQILLPSVTITREALNRLRAELVANRVFRKIYVIWQTGQGCLMYHLIDCASKEERQHILADDPKRELVIPASDTIIAIWDSAEQWSTMGKAAMNGLIIAEIDAELARRNRLNQAEERVRRQALAAEAAA